MISITSSSRIAACGAVMRAPAPRDAPPDLTVLDQAPPLSTKRQYHRIGQPQFAYHFCALLHVAVRRCKCTTPKMSSSDRSRRATASGQSSLVTSDQPTITPPLPRQTRASHAPDCRSSAQHVAPARLPSPRASRNSDCGERHLPNIAPHAMTALIFELVSGQQDQSREEDGRKTRVNS